MSLLIKGMAMPSSCIVCRLECLYRIHSSTSRSEHCPLIEIKDEGFYIEELPTEFNGITMQDADYLADEFLSTTPCNRMWDAMRALRDFYENVMNDAVEIAKQTEPNSSEKPNNSNDDKCFECDDFFTCDGQCDEVETEPQTERSSE